MKLNFLGSGSKFDSRKYGNTNCYIESQHKLTFLDFGYTSFMLMRDKLLNSEKKVEIIITNMDNDHIGGISDLILYFNQESNSNVKIISTRNILIDMLLYLEILGVKRNMFDIEEFDEDCSYYSDGHIYEYIVNSNDKEMESLSLILDGETLYAPNILNLTDELNYLLFDGNTPIIRIFLNMGYEQDRNQLALSYYELANFSKNITSKYFICINDEFDKSVEKRMKNIDFKVII